MWRIASFLAGLPFGALVAFALQADPWPLALEVGGAAGGLLFVLLASLAANRFRGEPDRGRHLAAALCLGWIALPGLTACWLGLRPTPTVWLALVTASVAAALWRAVRIEGPATGIVAPPAASALALGGGTLLAIVLGGALATLGAAPPPPTERAASYVWDIDAQVATLPLPRCAPRIASRRLLLERGANPRFSPDGRLLWFDASGPDGRRQVHRLDRASDEVECWTCDEPGNNRRPSPSPSGDGVVFDTDRHASSRHPTNTEVHLISARRQQRRFSRRLTHGPGPDDHALFDPGGGLLVWSRGHEGRFAVVTAAIQSGHGGVVLGPPRVVAAAGARWIAPLAWSPDAHALAVARGHPLRPAVATAIDFSSGIEWSLAGGLAPAGSVAFSADGSWLAAAGTRRATSLGLLPGSLGFLVGRLVALGGVAAPVFSGSFVRTGGTGAARKASASLAPVELGALADWGGSTGIGLEPDGTGFVLGQRRRGADGVEERLVEVSLECQEERFAS
jgi:hypothetical protein